MRTLNITAFGLIRFSFAALLTLLGATALAQSPAENAKAVLRELTEVKACLLCDFWASVSMNANKIGYVHVVSEKATDEKGNPAYKLTDTMVVQTASGKATVTKKALLSPSFRLASRTWEIRSAVHGFDEIQDVSNHAFSWTDLQVKITRAEKDNKGENVSVLSTLPDTICQVSCLFPLLAKKGPAKYAFSVLDIDEDKIDKAGDEQVEVLAAKEMKINGKTLEAVEVRTDDESWFFGKDGAFLMRRQGPRRISTALSKELAVSGLIHFDLEGDTDWTSVTKPIDVFKVLLYAMMKKDTALLDKIFSFRRYFKTLLEAQGRPVDDVILDGMVDMHKPRLKEQMLMGVPNMRSSYMLLIPFAMTVTMLSKDKAVLTAVVGSQTFTVEKINGTWIIVKMS
jgi:hypothetical protein